MTEQSTGANPALRLWRPIKKAFTGPETDTDGTVLRWWQRTWPFLLLVFIAFKVLWAVAGMVTIPAFEFIRHVIVNDPQALQKVIMELNQHISNYNPYTMWFKWDAHRYVVLAETSYTQRLDAEDLRVLQEGLASGERFPLSPLVLRFAWAPLFPLLGKLVGYLVGSASLGLFLVANAAFFGCIYYSYKLFEHHFGNKLEARRGAWLLLMLPAGFLLQSATTEGLFLCLSLATFYYIRTGKWAKAAVAALLVGLTRTTGPVMALAIVLLLLQNQQWRFWTKAAWAYAVKAIPAILAAPLGTALFTVYCWYMSHGDWGIYAKVQHAEWDVVPTNPLVIMWQQVADGVYTPRDMKLIIVLVMLAILVVCLFAKVPWAYVVYGGVLVMGSMSIGEPWADSILRYLSLVFAPAMLGVVMLRRRPWLESGFVAGAMMVQTVLFVTWAVAWVQWII